MRVVFTRPDGSIGIITPVAGTVAEVAERDVPVILDAPCAGLPAGTEVDRTWAEAQGAKYHQLPWMLCDEANIPVDRTFRNGWTCRDGTVCHDMAKCRDLARATVRRRREALWPAADAAVTKALARTDMEALREAEARREALRNAPADPRIEEAETPEALKAAIEEALKWPA